MSATYTSKEILELFSSDGHDLYGEANKLTEKIFGLNVTMRGLIEFSNICEKRCSYCGLKKDNPLFRYTMTKEEMVEAASYRYRSVVLQSGEVSTEERVALLCDTIKALDDRTITLSVGELPKEKYQQLFAAGARRYLLRIETSNRNLYSKLHPKNHSFDTRLKCLKDLQGIGYETGTGVLIGVPGQTVNDLVNDLLFFQQHGFDMIGMGPYLAPGVDKEKALDLSLKMVAIARLLLKDVNIVAATALQTIHPEGREKALLAGANVLMPILTPPKYRRHYQLYPGKPCVEEDGERCSTCLQKRLNKIGKKAIFDQDGISPHFLRCAKT